MPKPKQYSPIIFFRSVPNALLQQHFAKLDEFKDVDFSKLKEIEVDPIYQAWCKLPAKIRSDMEQDFQEINELATEGGIKAILDEANYHGESLIEQLEQFNCLYGKAFWTFLEHPEYLEAASAFYHADNVPPSYWRKRKSITNIKANTDKTTIELFEQAIGNYFYSQQGRGKNCKVDCYKRHDKNYFFAYPEDYAQATIEWEDNKFNRRPHNPAFEIIFVYSQNDGELDIFTNSGSKVVPYLQEIFANAILQIKLEEAKKDDLVYDLSLLLSRDFIFNYDAGIDNVFIKKMRLAVLNSKEKITLEVAPSNNDKAIYDSLDKLTNAFPKPLLRLTQAEIKVTFTKNPKANKNKTRSFSISYPNSCSLRHDGDDLVIRKMLKDSNIEPKRPNLDLEN
jgi:hypothetical protein